MEEVYKEDKERSIMVKVSIIVPVYQIQAKLLSVCIESLLKQTYKEIEIILIDDGSKDECSEICDDYAKQYNRIVVLHQENQGVSVARNNGISIATGEWITFVDADDVAEPTMCEKALSYALDCNADMVMFSNYIHRDNHMYEHAFFHDNIRVFTDELREELQLRTMVLYYPECSYKSEYMLTGHTFGKLIKKDYLLKSKVLFNPDLRLQQDGIFYMNLIELGGRIAYFNEPLYHYRVYDTSNCKRIRSDVEEIYDKVRRVFLEFIGQNDKPQKFLDAFYAKCIADISQSIRSDFFNYSTKESLFHRLKRLDEFLNNEPFKTAICRVNKEYLTKLKRRNLFYYRYGLLWLLWLDWEIYGIKSIIGRSRRK